MTTIPITAGPGEQRWAGLWWEPGLQSLLLMGRCWLLLWKKWLWSAMQVRLPCCAVYVLNALVLFPAILCAAAGGGAGLAAAAAQAAEEPAAGRVCGRRGVGR